MSAEHPQRRGAPSGGGRTIWKKMLAAQEFGLVVVIVLIMAGLTVGTKWAWPDQPTVQRTDRMPIPADAQVSVDDSGTITIVHAGRTRAYREADGYSLRGFTPGNQTLVHRYEVNRFLNKENLINVATTASFIAIMAVGATAIIVLGGIDLSVGSIYALAAVAGATVLQQLESTTSGWVALPVGIGACCLVGAACGAVNGAATVGLKVHPFIITLGGMAVYRGIAFVWTKGQSIAGFPPSYTLEGFRVEVAGVNPVPLLLMVAVAFVGVFVFRQTVFGRRMYAVGGNETAARYAGIPVGRIKIMLFAAGGALAGLSAAMLLGYYGAASSDAGTGYELRVIAAAVVGGASLSGGRGTALGAVLGAIVIQLIDNAIVVLGVDSNYTNIVIGLAIVLAVVVDQAKQRLTSRVR